MPLLPLDTWRAEMGLSPWHFWGFAHPTYAPIDSKCSALTFEYSWQGSDVAGRDDLRRAIERAEEMLLGWLNYRVAPQYAERTIPWPRAYEASMGRVRDLDATGRRVAVQLPEGQIRALGVEARTLIGTATNGGALTYSSQFSGGTFEDTFTIVLPTSVTDPAEIAVYFAAGDRWDGSPVSERWRVQPVQVSIAGGNVTIVGRKWLVAKPVLYQNPMPSALDPTASGSFVSELAVYRRYTDMDGNSTTTSQATLIYETSDCAACWGASCCCADGTAGSSDPGTSGLVIARAGIRDKVLGLVTPGAAVYDPSAGTWSSAWCCGTFCDPDRVTVRYLAGAPLEDGQMATRWQEITSILATAELKRRICACRESNERLHDLQQDLTLQSTTTERYSVSQQDMNNPFGTRRGHVQAWRKARLSDPLRRGIAV